MKIYMCGTDLLYFRAGADEECKIFATIETAKARLDCAEECGVVELDLYRDDAKWVIPAKPVAEWK